MFWYSKICPFVWSALLVAAPALAKKVPASQAELHSNAVSPALVDALAQELERSMTMRVGGAPAPYFISYKLTEVEVNDAVATLGALTSSDTRHFVSMEAHVHVGSYEQDNTNFVMPRQENLDGIASAQLPLEATPSIARKLAWLVTDQAYKEAIQQFAAKQDALRSGATDGGVANYTKARPVIANKPRIVPPLQSLAQLESRAKLISQSFRGKQYIRDSRVALTSFLERRWYFNSEGTASQDTRRVSGVLLSASSQASDGQELNTYYTKYGHTAQDLPTDAELMQAANTLGETLNELRMAPLIDSYTGPVLFTGEGAIGMIRYTLSPHLSGTPVPVGVSAHDAGAFGGDLLDKLGQRIVASNMNIYDDPNATHSQRKAVIGGFWFDDEGVQPQRIDIVKRGKLVMLPMSRTPSKLFNVSNGHARRSVAGGLFRGSPTNLFVTGKGGRSRGRLKRQLLSLIKREGLPYGVIVEQFDDYAITANSELSRMELFQILQSVDPSAPPMATIARRVFADGKEQLVRGVQLKRVAVDRWRQVVAIGRDPVVKNFLDSAENPALVRMRGDGSGIVPSSGVESSITTPDILFSEISIERSTIGRRPFPAVSRPD